MNIKKRINFNKGLTYVELIVVLSIFAIMSGITLSQYKDFQYVVDLKSFASEVALKAAEAQKNSANGKLIDGTYDPSSWRPSYGLKFDLNILNTAFLHFANLDNSLDINNFGCDTSTCIAPGYNGSYHNTVPQEESLEKLTLNKGFYISNIKVRGTDPGSTGCPPLPQPTTSVSNIQFLFERPSPKPMFFVSGLANCDFETLQYIDIILSSPNNKQTTIRMHASGQIQLI